MGEHKNQRHFKGLKISIAVFLLLAGVIIIVPLYFGQRHPLPHPVSAAIKNLKILKFLEEKYFAETGRFAPVPDGRVFYRVGNISITDVLPDFRPGPPEKLNFEYEVASSDDGRKFTATATGRAGTAVVGENFLISQDSSNPAKTVTLMGRLVNVAAIGGETTGWALELDVPIELYDKKVSRIEVDFAGTKPDEFKDKKVEITGTLEERHGVERREYWVISVEKISEIK